MPLSLLNHSALALFAQRTRIPTSARSIGFCAIWVCISSSSSSLIHCMPASRSSISNNAAECARVYYASKQAPRGEMADQRGAPSPIPHLIGESEIPGSAIRRPTSTSALSANHIPWIEQPSTGEQLPSSCRGVSPVSVSLVVCITADLLTGGALPVQDDQDPTSFGKNFFPTSPCVMRVLRS